MERERKLIATFRGIPVYADPEEGDGKLYVVPARSPRELKRIRAILGPAFMGLRIVSPAFVSENDASG